MELLLASKLESKNKRKMYTPHRIHDTKLSSEPKIIIEKIDTQMDKSKTTTPASLTSWRSLPIIEPKIILEKIDTQMDLSETTTTIKPPIVLRPLSSALHRSHQYSPSPLEEMELISKRQCQALLPSSVFEKSVNINKVMFYSVFY